MTAHFEDAAADLRRQVAALERELQAAAAERDEALAQRAATAEVFEVINASPENLAAVFDAISEKAIRLCGADFGGIWLFENGRVLPVGGRNLPQAYLDSLTRDPPPPSQVLGRAARERPYIHILDLIDTEAYRNGLALTVNSVKLGGIRTFLAVPLRDGGSTTGMINLYRQEVRPFTDNQIALVQAFAEQALIAMKNARLFNETQEALERQTATSEILRVISQSPTDARPVFERIVLTAARSLHCDFAFVLLRDGDAYIHTAGATPQGPMTDLAPDRVPIDPSANFPSRAILAKETLYLPDWSQIELPEHERNIREAFNITSALYLPLMREGECIGVIGVGGQPAEQFRSQRNRPGRVVSRSGDDRDRERAAVQRNAGGAGAAEGLGGRAGRDQQVRRGHGAGVRDHPRRMPTPFRQRGNRHLRDRRRRDGACRRMAGPEGRRSPSRRHAARR